MSRTDIKRMVTAAVCLVLCYVLPFLTGQIPQIGAALSPMHLPALLCGFLAGPWYALAVGLIAPITRSLMFGMPNLYPTAVAMSFELAAYGFFSGLLYSKLPKKLPYVYVSLVGAMILGRVVWGVAQAVLLGIGGSSFGMSAFVAGAITGAVPGMIAQIVLVPAIVMALDRAKLFPKK